MVSGTTSEASDEMTPRVRLRAEALAETSADTLPLARSSILDARAAVEVFVSAADAEAAEAEERSRSRGRSRTESVGKEKARGGREAEDPVEGPFGLAAAAAPELLEGREEEEASRSMLERIAPDAFCYLEELRTEEKEKKRR